MIDAELTERVRTALKGVRGITEMRMFSGIAFLLNGNLMVAASNRGLLVRAGADAEAEALSREGAKPLVMRGRPLTGYFRVDPSIRSAAEVTGWVRLAHDFVRTLPLKAVKAAKKKAKAAKKKTKPTQKKSARR